MSVSLDALAMETRDAVAAPIEAELMLAEAALSGDGLAFRRLVEPHLPMLLRIASRVAGASHVAEDAVQETLALAFRRLGSYRHDRPFRAFLAAIAVRQARTQARAERRRQRRERRADVPGAAPDPEQELRAATGARAIRRALHAMPHKRREAALLRLDAGLSYREIAAALGSTEGSARVLVHTALAELRRELGELIDPG